MKKRLALTICFSALCLPLFAGRTMRFLLLPALIVCASGAGARGDDFGFSFVNNAGNVWVAALAKKGDASAPKKLSPAFSNFNID